MLLGETRRRNATQAAVRPRRICGCLPLRDCDATACRWHRRQRAVATAVAGGRAHQALALDATGRHQVAPVRLRKVRRVISRVATYRRALAVFLSVMVVARSCGQAGSLRHDRATLVCPSFPDASDGRRAFAGKADFDVADRAGSKWPRPTDEQSVGSALGCGTIRARLPGSDRRAARAQHRHREVLQLHRDQVTVHQDALSDRKAVSRAALMGSRYGAPD
jgi:hypothetical protein